jgi:fatty acid desaturase
VPANAKAIDLRRLRSTIPDDVFELPRIRTFAKALFLLALLSGALVVGSRMESVAGRLLLGIAMGPFVFALASVGHEAGHRTASRWRFLNDLTGLLTMSVLGIPSFGWKIKHDIHHKYGGVARLDTDAEWGLDDYLALGPLRRWWVRTFGRHEFLLWWAAPISLWITSWRFAIANLFAPRRAGPRRTLWSLSDIAVAAGFFFTLVLYTATFGWLNLLFLVLIPFAGSGVVAAVAFVPNHRAMPPLTMDQARRAARYTHINSRTVTYPLLLPGNYFMNYVPWQIEHHVFPTVAGYRLPRVSPCLKAYAKEEGIRLQYETIFRAIPRILRRDWLWGNDDGRLYSFAEAEQIRRERLARPAPSQP